MFITHLALTNYRSYTQLDLHLNPGINIFIGKNGEGKTNIVESILYLSYLSSHRTSSDAPLVQLGSTAGYVRAKVENGEREILLELEINAEKANRARINQNTTRSQRELLGLIQAIYFSPEDLDLVRGDPAIRRRFIDQLLILRYPRLAAVMSDYDRAVKQRNSLLKSRSSNAALQPWNQHLAKFGGEIIAARFSLLEDFNPTFTEVYKEISPEKKAYITYKSSIDDPTTNPEENSQKILEKIESIIHQEVERGVSLVGPHRDDLLLMLGNHFVKGYASHGESWSVALSLKLASYQLLQNEGARPILILDDVFSELDEDRRTKLIALANTAEQTFITVAVQSDLPDDLTGQTFAVKSGSVKVQA